MVVAGCMDGAVYTIKLKTEEKSGEMYYKLPVFK